MPGKKGKTIKAIIAGKLSKWFESIEDESVRKMAVKNTIVTGGCIASMLLGEDVNDFDIYFRDKATVKAVAEYYVARFLSKNTKRNMMVQDENERIKIVIPSAGVSEDSSIITVPETIEDTHEDTEIASLANDGEGKFVPVFLSSNAITLSDKIQIVLRFYGEPDGIHENYDFAHCMNYYSNWDGKLILRPEALESLLSKELRYVGSKYPVCSIVRLRKFIARGWRINAGQVLKMAMQVSELDLTKVEVLEDQLTGVDTSYFLQLITKLKEKDPDKVETAYLIEIIDRIF
jgi:hypothetical protein